MKQCLVCKSGFSISETHCPECGAYPETMDGFAVYAPEMARDGNGFKASFFEILAPLEEANFWFRARNRIIIWALKKYASTFQNFLEIGCGTGFVLSGVGRNFPNANLSGSDIFTDGLVFASKRLPSVNLMQFDARNIPFVDEFDVVGAFDVLEHIKEDETALSQIYKILHPGGIALITVPQHMWLWSEIDDYSFHERRYSSKEIEGKVKAAGFKILKSTSFVTLLLPVMMLSRLLVRRRIGSDPSAELKLNPFINRVFELILYLEYFGVQFGMDFSIGGSRLLVAQRD